MKTSSPGMIHACRRSFPGARRASWLLLFFSLLSFLLPCQRVGAAGTWTALAHKAPSNIELMLLLTDGTVMAANYGGNAWYRLTPDSTGSYINGTWTTLASMHNTRLYYSSDVLRDGRVFVAGGEYGTGGSLSEVYDPVANTWTQTPQAPVNSFIDSVSETLANGNVLVAPVSPSTASTLIYNISSNTWSAGPSVLHGQDEVAWVKLPDGSILTVDGQRTTTERYIPAQNKWVADATVPVTLYDGNGETGPCFLLPNGNVFTIGGTGHSAIYTPSGTASPGTWIAGPDVPGSGGMADAPGAMMVNGVILCATGPAGTLTSPVTFYEYDPVANAFTAINAPNGGTTLGTVPYVCNMLDLPDGTILFSSDSSQLYEYKPTGAALAAGQPAISGIVANADGSFTLSGTLLNGISEGAAYGDDAQMASNYPIVRLTSSTGSVYFARSFGWGTGVMTGATPETTNFTLPLGIPAGTYSVAVVVNGNASSAVSLSIPVASGDAAPTVATAAAASPNPTATTTASLSVLGADADGGGEPNLGYTWTITSAPSGVSTPSFSINGTNAAKNTTATFHHSGSYTFTVLVTDQSGLSTTSSVNVTVNQTLTTVVVTPTTAGLTSGDTQQLSATGYDQFGNSMSSQPTFTWAIASGAGTVSSSGLYTSPASGTLATVTATTGALHATATIGVVSAPWNSDDVGSPALAGYAYDSSGVFTVVGEGSDIWNKSDEFHYVWRPMGGDGMIIARIASQQNTDGWAKAGVMIRNSTAEGDQYALMMISPGNGTDLQYRTTSGGSAAAIGNTTGFAAPYWLKLVRSGNTFTGYRSPDGVTWTKQGATTITMGASVCVGLAVDSHNTSALNTSTFDHLSMLDAAADSLVATPGVPASVNVLTNDIGPSGATLTVTAVTQGSKGTVVNNGNGTVTYTANSNALGTDSFVYTISDGLGDTATATVTVSINGLQAYYQLDENTGTTSADVTGDGYTATLQGATWTTGISGSALSFNGSSNYATIPALNLRTNTMTITGWIKRNGAQSAFSGLVFCRAGSTVSGLHFGNASELRYTWNNAASTYNWNSGLTPPSAQWTFVALVVTPTNATIYMYPNGGTLQSATNSVANTASAFDGVTDFGQDPSGGRFYNGAMDEVRIYNTALTRSQIAGLIAGVNGDQAPTVATAAAASPNPVTGSTSSLSVLGADDGGESALTYSWAATAVPSGATAPTFSVNGTNTAKNATATFSKAGAYTLTATITDAVGLSVTSSVNVTVNQTPTTVVISPTSATVASHATSQFTATMNDQFGTALAVQPTFTWTNTGSGSVSTAGLYTAQYAAGSATVTAASGVLSKSASVTITNATPTIATAAGASPTTVTGTTTNLSVLGADADGGGESNLTYTWSATFGTGGAAPAFSVNNTNAAKNTTATFTKPGSYTFKVVVADAGGLSVTSSNVVVAVNVAFTSISVSPASSTLGSHGNQQFTATANDQFGTALTSQPSFTWNSTGSGSISASGLYTAAYATGTGSVTATSGTISKSAAVTINNAAPTVATAAAASPSTVTGSTTALSVLGADTDGGGESSLTYTWSATTIPAGAGTPTYSPNGTNAAKSTTVSFTDSGTYTFKVTIADLGGATVTSSVNVTVNMKPFLSWQLKKFGANASNPAIAGDSADPDGDGISNLMEYAGNTDPLTPYDGSLPVLGVEGSNLTLTYLQNDAATDLTYTVQETTDFVTWSPANPTLTTISDDGTTRVVKASVPKGAVTKLMLRLSVTRQ